MNISLKPAASLGVNASTPSIAPQATTPAALPNLVDANGIPYKAVFSKKVTVNVYGFEVPATITGNQYDSAKRGSYIKVATYFEGVLTKEGESPRPYILKDDLATSISVDDAVALALQDVQTRLYSTSGPNGPIANIALLGSQGAFLDKNGFPIMYMEDHITTNENAAPGQVKGGRILYKVSANRTYINLYPLIARDRKTYANDVEAASMSLIEGDYISSVTFLQNRIEVAKQVKDIAIAALTNMA